MTRKIDNTKALKAGFEKAVARKDADVQSAFRSALKEIIADAVEGHNFDNRTFNLENSYGWAIYHGHVMVEHSVAGSGDGATRAEAFLSSYLPLHDWEGVVCAGAEYASDLEGYVRRSNGIRSKAGDELFVLGKFFDSHMGRLPITLKLLAKL